MRTVKKGNENMELIKINGTKEINGKEIKIIEGGFGEGCKILTDKQIAEIHNIEPKHIRETINRNRKRFKSDIDIIDLKGVDVVDTLLELGYHKASITQAKNIYALSERGYSKLIKIMDTDLAWDIHDELMDNYFKMREIIQQQQFKLPTTFKEALVLLLESVEEKERLLLENETISLEKRLLSGEIFTWANRSLINALVRRFARGDFGFAWKEYKKNLLYSHSININSRITNYLNKTGKRTKPKTLDMLDDSEIPNAIATIVSMCNEQNIDISDVIKHHKDGVKLVS